MRVTCSPPSSSYHHYTSADWTQHTSLALRLTHSKDSLHENRSRVPGARSTSGAFTPVFAGYCDALQTQDRSSLWRSQMCFALHRIRDTNRRSGVAEKPQAAAMRAKILDREL